MGCSVSGRAGVVCEGAAGAVRRGARPFGAFCAAVLMGGTGGPTLAEETWQLCHGVGWEVTGADPEVLHSFPTRRSSDLDRKSVV